MTQSLAEKARANRRAALAALNVRIGQGQNVVSIFDRVIQRRRAVPEFHSTRSRSIVSEAPARPAFADPVAA